MGLDKFSLTDRVALVTGASRGLGKAIALAMAEAGADLVLASRTREALDKVAAEVRERGRRALPVAANVAVADEVNAMVDAAIKEYGRVDILVNNAGISPFLVPSLELREAGLDKVMSVNLKGTFLCAQAVAKAMIAQGGGSIINMASTSGMSGDPGTLAYSVSKAAVISLTRVLASEWAKHGIRVNAISPSLVGAGMNEGLMQQPHLIEALSVKMPFRRPAKVEEVADVAVFLASDAASYLTAQNLVVDGGSGSYSPITIGSVVGKIQL